MANNNSNTKLNTASVNQDSIISDTIENIIPDTKPDPVDNTIQNTTSNTKKSNPARNGGTLISLADRTLEERREIGRKGGLKSGETKRNRKTMKDTIIDMLSQELSINKLEDMGIDTSTLNGDYTMQGAIIAAMLREAVNGSEKAMQLIRDTMGEAPVLRQEVQQEIITKDDIDLMDNVRKQLLSS